MFNSETCQDVPVPGGRWWGGGLVEVEDRVVWGGREGVFEEVNSKWRRVADGGTEAGTLAVCGGRLEV